MATIVDMLRLRAAAHEDRIAYVFLADGEEEEASITYGELDKRARAIAAELQAVATVGDRALLLDTPGLNYITAFFGCLYAGVVAVPLYTPRRKRRGNDRLEPLVADSSPKVAFIGGPANSATRALVNGVCGTSVAWIQSEGVAEERARGWAPVLLNGENIAFLQYTSGSTSTPKGVMVSHDNILHNEEMIKNAFGTSADSVIVGWLPLYHDMGLIGNVLQPLYTGASCVLMSPFAFLQRPIRWLRAISHYRATTSGGPDFAYDLCVRKVSPEHRKGLDLSSWRVAFNGSETIRSDTLDRFVAEFESCGFRREAFQPCYGLAEATLFVTGAPAGRTPLALDFAADALERGRVEFAQGHQRKSLVSCGHSPSGQDVRIVCPESKRPTPAGAVGEIWVSGPSVAKGYWGRAEESEATFRARIADQENGTTYLRTGDLGFIHEGELFVTGRIKDLIIIRGLNYYPQDIECTVRNSHAALHPGAGAAFCIEVAGTEALVVVHEVAETGVSYEQVAENIRRAVAEEHELELHAVVLAERGAVSKTSSGKIQRRSCRTAYLEGTLAAWYRWEATTRNAAAENQLCIAEGTDGLKNWLSQRLAQILGIRSAEIDIHRPLVCFGLDSLRAVELVHELEFSFGLELSFTAILEHSVASLTTSVLSARPTPKSLREETRPGAAGGPLSFGQKAIHFLQQLQPESPAYTIAKAIRIHGALNVAVLQESFQTLVNRHDALRTRFPNQGGHLVQQVDPPWRLTIHEENVAEHSVRDFSALLSRRANAPFDLANGHALRVELFKESEDKSVLLFAVHHIVADFWSLALLMQELKTIYTQKIAGQNSNLAPLTARYRDFVSWQEQALEGHGEDLFRYWTGQLGESPLVLDLPTDRPRPPSQSFRGAVAVLKISQDRTKSLHALAESHSATLFTMLLSAFQVLLHRYSSQRQFCVGAPVAGRNLREFASVVGYFVNTVVFRAHLQDDPSFEMLLGRMRIIVRQALDHQDYPFPLLVERLGLLPDPSRNPIFQAMFSFHSSPFVHEEGITAFAIEGANGALPMADLTLETLALDRGISLFDLTLAVAESKSGLIVNWTYNTDLFDATTIVRMSLSFENLLKEIVEAPYKHVSELKLLTEGERHEMLEEWNRTEEEYEKGKSVGELVEEQAERTPGAVAVVGEDGELTYGDLNGRANQVGRYLRKQGVRAEKRVGICMERGVEMVAVLLGIMKAGGAYVPLDGSYPEERLRYMVEDAGAEMVVVEGGMGEKWEGYGGRLLKWEEERERMWEESKENIGKVVEAENLAYVIYTSGSTGKPKGVAVQHKSLANLHRALQQHIYSKHPPGTKRAGLNAPIVFDSSVKQFLLLLSGYTLFIVPETVRQGGRELLEFIKHHSLDTVDCTPSHLEMLVSSGLLESTDIPTTFLIGGETIQEPLWRKLARATAARFYNVYGPTECTVDATAMCVSGDAGQPSIGRPLCNTRAYVLDEWMKALPIGITGELYLGGAGVARGYWNSPDLTAERFLPDAFGEAAGERLYRTGDLVKWRPDGSLEFVGRADQQVKIRGYRIELGEIESAVAEHPRVLQVVVVSRPDATNGMQLVAFLRLAGPEPLATEELRSQVAKRLPGYMIPSFFVPMEAFPLTPNGKIDQERLLVPEINVSQQHFVAPRDPVERSIAQIWQEVLGVDRVGIHDDFFRLGGHSLTATQVLSRVRRSFHADVAMQSLFQASTLETFAEQVRRHLIPNVPDQVEVSRVLEEVENLSDDEVRQFLAFMDSNRLPG